jgi:hypothetical protein
VLIGGIPPDETYWPNDDQWAGHYLLLTGYDDDRQAFIAQDTFAEQTRLCLIRPCRITGRRSITFISCCSARPGRDGQGALLGDNWDPDANRQHALAGPRRPRLTDDAFAWFNLGSNLVYFEEYGEAASIRHRPPARPAATHVTLPVRSVLRLFLQRARWDLKALVDYALGITPNAEEAMLWRGWGLYRREAGRGDRSFNAALVENPTTRTPSTPWNSCARIPNSVPRAG